MASKYFQKVLDKSPKYIKIFTSKSFDIIDRIHEILESKNLNQKDLAQLLGKEESEISKLLSVGHNLTLKTISKLEEVLKADLLVVPKKEKVLVPKSIDLNTKIKVENKRTNLNNSNCQITDKEIKSTESKGKIYKLNEPLSNKRTIKRYANK